MLAKGKEIRPEGIGPAGGSLVFLVRERSRGLDTGEWSKWAEVSARGNRI